MWLRNLLFTAQEFKIKILDAALFSIYLTAVCSNMDQWPGKKEGSGGSHQCPSIPEGRVQREGSQAPFSSSSGPGTGHSPEHSSSLCLSGSTAVLCGAGVLAKAAQRLWDILLGAAHGAGPCSAGLCWGRGTRAASNFNHSITCDSLKECDV